MLEWLHKNCLKYSFLSPVQDSTCCQNFPVLKMTCQLQILPCPKGLGTKMVWVLMKYNGICVPIACDTNSGGNVQKIFEKTSLQVVQVSFVVVVVLEEMDVQVNFFTLNIAHCQKADLCVLDEEDDLYTFFSESIFRPVFLYFYFGVQSLKWSHGAFQRHSTTTPPLMLPSTSVSISASQTVWSKPLSN